MRVHSRFQSCCSRPVCLRRRMPHAKLWSRLLMPWPARLITLTRPQAARADPWKVRRSQCQGELSLNSMAPGAGRPVASKRSNAIPLRARTVIVAAGIWATRASAGSQPPYILKRTVSVNRAVKSGSRQRQACRSKANCRRGADVSSRAWTTETFRRQRALSNAQTGGVCPCLSDRPGGPRRRGSRFRP